MPNLSIPMVINDSAQKRKTRIFLFLERNLVFLLVLVFYLLILLWDIDEPWIGLYDLNGAFFGTMVKKTINNADLSQLFSYWHHPFLFQLLLYSFCQIFGLSEATLRIVPIIFSLGNITLLYCIALEELDKKIANISVIIFAFMPMTAYFGRMVAHESASMFFILLTYFFYLKYLKTTSNRYLISSYSSFFLGTITGWPVYYVYIPLALHAFFHSRNKKRLGEIGIFFVIGLFSFFLIINAYAYYSRTSLGNVIQSLVDQGEIRRGIVPFFEFVGTEVSRSLHWFGEVVILMFFAFYYSEGFNILQKIKNERQKFRKILQEKKTLVLPLNFLLIGLIHIFLFVQGALIHDYWLYYLSIGLIIPCSIILSKQDRRLTHVFIIFYILTSLFTLDQVHKNDEPLYYEIGTHINERTYQNDTIIVVSRQIGYYGDCNYILLDDLNSSVEWLSRIIVNWKQEGNPIKFVIINDKMTLKEKINQILTDAEYSLSIWGQFLMYSYNEN